MLVPHILRYSGTQWHITLRRHIAWGPAGKNSVLMLYINLNKQLLIQLYIQIKIIYYFKILLIK